ncbi:MAG: glycoside hydrolase/phage tail family protein [Pseudomonadota bacterium]
MATIVLSAVGAAAGASLGGGILGLSSVVLGRAVGATVGQAIDRNIFQGALGGGSDLIEQGKTDRLRLTSASEGAAIRDIYGRVRVAGQVIWASDFLEDVATETVGGSGKGSRRQPQTTVASYSYSISLAIAVGRGRVTRLGRIWADGQEIGLDELNLRFYDGSEEQLPDPKIEAVEGIGEVPAFRGVAYVVLEDLELGRFGNRVPQFSFEVTRADQGDAAGVTSDLKAVALIPGTGEYALATTPVRFETEPGNSRSANVNTPGGQTDFSKSVDALHGDLPAIEAVSLVVSWFGDDLRCGACKVEPKVEQADVDGVEMPWRVSGVARSAAGVLPKVDGRVIYGGTPSDASVVEAIEALAARGSAVMFYPFLLMEQLEGNTLLNPLNGETGQPALPWRGRITTSKAPGIPGSPDGTETAEAEVAAFFGAASPDDFVSSDGAVTYAGPPEASYRRFILHYAHLCAAAGGVAAFCIGSEMRGLTQIRGAANSFPAVEALRQLASDVRTILGPDTKIGYAADWTEYFGFHPQDGTGDVFFHLDPLWSDDAIDFVGIDNYMPLSDWREGYDHADSAFGSIYNLDYLTGNIEGGEGYDWYYGAPEVAAAQNRQPIMDGAYGEPWVFRYKDIRNWWSRAHHERIGGIRQSTSTGWQPRGKPIWFTEIGCPAIDKGTNQPNVFLDVRSSEAARPVWSNGNRDDLIQRQYLRAVCGYWSDPSNNPVSDIYGGSMIDTGRVFAWAWDTRPYPYFPANSELWSDGGNYARGHWLNGRLSSRTLASVVAEISGNSGVTAIDTTELYGLVKGYSIDQIGTGRSALQPLLMAYGADAIERDGTLTFRSRSSVGSKRLDRALFAATDETSGDLEVVRAPEAEIAGRLRIGYVESDGDYEARLAEAVFPDDTVPGVAEDDVPLVLTGEEARGVAERWLAEARIAKDRIQFALPPSARSVGAGDVIEIEAGAGSATYRVDNVEVGGFTLIEAVRSEREVYQPSDAVEALPAVRSFVSPTPVFPTFLDLPIIRGDELPHAPRIAVTAEPWPGPVAVVRSADGSGYSLDTTVEAPSVLGVTLSAMGSAEPSRWDRGPALRVRLYRGDLSAATEAAVLNGTNIAAIGNGMTDVWEVFQFAGAQPVEPGVWDLSMRLRGQAGTEAIMPSEWPVGSRFVLIDGAQPQLSLPSSARGLARTYRIGPAAQSYDHPVYVEETRAFPGVGLRPFAPVHVQARRRLDGGLSITWIRRTRIDGDTWEGLDVPLGEATERYLLRVLSPGLVREIELDQVDWIYTAAEQAADGVVAPFDIEIAQVSEQFGPGPFRRILVDV